jgi:hypothetical protein
MIIADNYKYFNNVIIVWNKNKYILPFSQFYTKIIIKY